MFVSNKTEQTGSSLLEVANDTIYIQYYVTRQIAI
jgi:hypothetical protein